MRGATGVALAALLALHLAGGAAAQQTQGAASQAAQAQDAPRAEDAEAHQGPNADAPESEEAGTQEAPEAEDAPAQKADTDPEQAQDAQAEQAGGADARDAQAEQAGDADPQDAQAADPQAMAECLIANSGEEEESAFRDFLTFALTEEPQDVLRQSAAAFSGGMIAIGATQCGMALADFQTEAGRQAAAAYTQHLAQQVMEAAFARLAR